MHPLNDEYLTKTYPTLFRDRHGDIRSTCMCWGFEVADGWFRIIDDACKQLEWLNKEFPEIVIIADQIKEKYGTLRFYKHVERAGEVDEHDSTSVERERLVHIFDIANCITDYAEHRSECICENCGSQSAKLRTDGWYRTLCDKCEAWRDYERSGGV
jgi:hypothetical protein